MLKQFIAACSLGLCLILYTVQYDPWIHAVITDSIATYAPDYFGAHVRCTCTAFSLYNGTITLQDVVVTPLNPAMQWYWYAQRLQLRCSWWQLMWYGTLDFFNELDGLVAQAYLKDGTLDIQDHVERLFQGPALLLHTMMQAVTLRNATIAISEEEHGHALRMVTDIYAQRVADKVEATVDMYDGSVTYDGRLISDHAGGSLQLALCTSKPHIDMTMQGASSVTLCQLGTESTPCQMSCSWHHNRGIFSIKNLDNSFVIDPLIIKKGAVGTQVSVVAHMPLRYICSMLNEQLDALPIAGSCAIEMKYSDESGNAQIKGHALAQRITCADNHIGSLAKIDFQSEGAMFTGNMYIQRTSGACAGGSWHFDPLHKVGNMRIKNSSRLSFLPEHDWRILPDDATCDVTVTQDGADISYVLRATDSKTDEQVDSHGTVHIDAHGLHAQGMVDNAGFDLHLQREAAFVLDKATIERDQQQLLQIKRDDNAGYAGVVDVLLIKEVMRRFYKFNLQGEGRFAFEADRAAAGYALRLHLDDGAIRLPRTYNFINGFNAHITVADDYTVEMRDMLCTLHNGRMSSALMRASFDATYRLRSYYVPLLFEHCLLNMDNDLFAIVSGDVLLHKQASGTTLHGNILLDRAQIKGNIFSDVFQKNMRNYTAYSFENARNNIVCDVTIQTKNPVKVQTPFLITDARIDLKVHEAISNPEVTGVVQLHGGQLNFPYKPLYLTKGALHFMPGRLEDPLIELVAKNAIKKNNIRLQVSGSLQDHHISLESSPSLSEEQIISLLLVGSQEDSLNVVMPALLMHNIKALLFGYDQSTSAMSRYFNNILKPFKRIHLVPSFVDQSGRGGLRGAIEIDISDRWRAIIEKNFSLSEDTRFELEYLFSDDISMRVVRDIRRDLIAEVETRWKFGSR